MTALAGKGLVLVEHGYEYLGRDGGLVSIKPNERYVLLSKTNNDWWHVRKDENAKPIYIPARYVKELPSHFPSPLDFIQQLSDSAAPEQGGHKGAADLPEKRPDEVTIKLRSAPNRRRQENRLSTFGVPLDVHEPSFMRSGLVDPMIALLPRTAASPHSKDVSSHLKRYSLAPSALFGSHPPAEELQPHAVKLRIPSFSPVDPTIRPAQAKPVVPPIIKDLPRVQEPTEQSKPPAETEEPSRQDPENIYESILDIQEQQQKELPGSGIGPALSLAPAPSPASSPAPSPASSSLTPAPASSSNPASASSSLTPAPTSPAPASSSNPAPASSFPASASSSNPAPASSSNPAPSSSSNPAPASSSNPAPASSSPAPASLSPAPAPASSSSSASASAVVITAAPGPLSPPAHIPSQVKNENPTTAVYANVAELKSSTPPPPPSGSSFSGAFHFPPAPPGWETNNNEEGKSEQQRTPGTGKSAWDNPGCPSLDQEPPLQVLPPGLAPHLPTVSPQAPAAGRTEQKQLLDEAAGRHFLYSPVSGGMSWLPPVPTTPCPSPPMEPKSLQNVPDDGPPPLPEEDYPTEERGAHLVHPKDYNFARIKQTVIPRASLGSGGPAGWLSMGDPEGQGPLAGEQQPPVPPGQPDLGNGVIMDSIPVMKNWRHTIGPAQFNVPQGDAHFFPTHTRSPSDYASDASSVGNSPESRLFHQTQNLEKAGILNKTKISENGKRLRKSWSQSWTVLHDGILTFHKDPKSSTSGISGKTTQILPEYTIELRGAVIGWASKEKSSKKNVLELKTRHGSEYLIQYDTDSIITDWHKVILDSIRQQDLDYHPKEEVVVEEEVSEKSPGTGPTDRDDKDKRRISNRTSMTGPGTDSEQGRVRHKLRKFLQRRPTLQSVKEKGYIQENVFGCHLDTLCRRENSTTPSFMEKCIKSVEERGLDVDGIYRVSGNLAVIQKLRHKADHEEDLDLDDGQWEEIHVITGALKLFLRELPEPLFPFSHFDGFIAAIKLTDYSQRVSYMCDLVKTLPLPNHNTMKLLFTHLRKVIEYKDVNRMSVQSVAIVFGPTLLRPETESANITVHMVFQNQIVELILNEYEKIFCQD